MTPSPVPSRLHRVKVFEAQFAYLLDGDGDGGRRLLPSLSTPTIETRVDMWVDATRNLVLYTGPVNLVRVSTSVSGQAVAADMGWSKNMVTKSVAVEVDVYTLAVVYAPAVEQPADVSPAARILEAIAPTAPQPGTGEVRGVAEPTPAGGPGRDGPHPDARGVGPAGPGAGGSIRLPDVP